MLVLSRKQDQTVVIDGNIRVTILQIKGKVARIGINAPKDVSILRAELDSGDDNVPNDNAAGMENLSKRYRFAEKGAFI